MQREECSIIASASASDTEQGSPLSSPENLTKEKSSSLKFIGIARCVTDFTAFIYITDIGVGPAYRGKGLGTWLMERLYEVIESMPRFRKSMLATGD